MSLLLQVLVGVLVVILCVVVCGCMIVVRQYLRHLDQQQRLGVEVRHDPGEFNAPTSIEIYDGNDNVNYGPGVRNRQNNYPQHPRHHQVPPQGHSNYLQMGHMNAPPGTILTTTTTVTTTTTASRTPSPGPPTHPTYATYAPHTVQHPAGARGAPHVQDRFVSGQDRTVARMRAGRVVRNQQADTDTSAAPAHGGDSGEVKNWMDGQKSGEGKQIAQHFERFFRTLGGAEKKNQFGKKMVDILGEQVETFEVAINKIKSDKKPTAETKRFARYLELNQLVDKKDTKGMNQYFRDLFGRIKNWRERKLSKDFNVIYDTINKQCLEKSKKELKDLPFSADTYIGWDYKKKELVYVAPDRNFYMNNFRGKKEFTRETICHFRFDTFFGVRQRLRNQNIIKSEDEYKLRMYRKIKNRIIMLN